MTKDETQQLKGFAILLMLWLHLFSDTDLGPLTHCLLPFFGGKPLAFAFSRIAAACVPIYIFLGGYGLTCVYRQRQGSMHNARRALSLMANFWMVFLLFVPLACITNPLLYPGSLLTLLLNVVAIDYSYNGAWWFLLPYVVLTLGAAPLIRRVLREQYRNGVDGLSGNEDVGQMSAWYVLSAMGLYQVEPAGGKYIIGSPLFDETSINVGDGKTFTIKAENNSDENIYVQSATLNGKRYDKSYIHYGDIIAGGTLTLTMGPKPSKWGTSKKNRP